MNILSESGLLFQFEDSWDLIKYDEHRYYLSLSGQSFSGVDFAGFYDEQLYFIEVKNFYQYDQNGVINNVDQFITDIIEKLMDTFRLIELIQKYHERNFMYRTLFAVVKRLPWLHRDWDFWTKMSAHLMRNKPVFLLFIHANIDMGFLEDRINANLPFHENIRNDFHLLTIDSSIQIPGCVITLNG